MTFSRCLAEALESNWRVAVLGAEVVLLEFAAKLAYVVIVVAFEEIDEPSTIEDRIVRSKS